VERIFSVAVMSNETKKNTRGEGVLRLNTDVLARREEDQTGLGTPVVFPVKDSN
jgi:hypothetical protein